MIEGRNLDDRIPLGGNSAERLPRVARPNWSAVRSDVIVAGADRPYVAAKAATRRFPSSS